jgi:hypothetical protein
MISAAYLRALFLTSVRRTTTLFCAFGSVLSLSYESGGRGLAVAQPPGLVQTASSSRETIHDAMKGYEKLPGLITLYRGTEEGRLKLYAEIREEQLDRPFLLQATFSAGNPRPEITAGTPVRDLILKFSRTADDRVLLFAPDIWHRADGERLAAAVARDFPSTYLEIFTIAAKQAESRSLLIEISKLFQDAIAWPETRARDAQWFSRNESLLDLYETDINKTFLSSVSALPDFLSIVVQYHFQRRTRAAPGGAPDAVPGEASADAKPPEEPQSLPLKMIYHLRSLPDQGYRPRLADPRVGYFVNGMPSANRVGFEKFDDDQGRDSRVAYINRWRLEKRFPKAPVSPPRRPIVFWIGKSVPLQFRVSVREGILMWSRAFDRLSFKDAIIVRQTPDDATWDEADTRYNTIRWVAAPLSDSSAKAEAFVRENPFTGEILNASINISDGLVRLARAQVRDLFAMDDQVFGQAERGPARCQIGEQLRFQGWFGLLALRRLGPPSVAIDEKQYIDALLRDAVAHEMGHALGLRHNFVASAYLDSATLSDPQTVATIGVSASVMDYLPFNIFALHRSGVDYFSSTIGPYDHWAIEYGYKPIEAKTPEEEEPELQRIAAHSNEPGLAYESDELADLYDPSVVRYDLGRDPLLYWEEALNVTQRLISNLENWKPPAGEDSSEFTRLLYALIQARGEYLGQLVNYIGGLRVRRSEGGKWGQLPQIVPLSAAEQQRALDVLGACLFDERAWMIPRAYFSRLAADPYASNDNRAASAFPIRDEIVKIRSQVLQSLFSPERLGRIINNEYKVAHVGDTLSIPRLFLAVRQFIWMDSGESRGGRGLQRELQRAHLDQLMLLTEASDVLPGDVCLFALQELRDLRATIIMLLRKKTDLSTRLHLEQSLARIRAALGK